MMQREFHRAEAFAGQVLKELVSVLLMKAKSDHLNSASISLPSPASNRLLGLFTDLYMKDISRIQLGQEVIIRKISDYAKELGVTQNHLNDSVREVTGKSAGTLIREQVIKQATMCLRQSSKSVSEIGYLLGFQDPSYFSRYYKKQTGKLPSEVRLPMP
jgi:AraC family transcriptional regulator, transcriptional activator of pobA